MSGKDILFLQLLLFWLLDFICSLASEQLSWIYSGEARVGSSPLYAAYK